ncbi:ETS-related transcription factor Elf-4-like isoform X2 [Corticium candelabrum]|uniref:ETS-related transcription factor Elf-4-like isoform X2 n=1 Tax=Corticium candelabrum TaxID=121492 RepID=UPI002E26095B|nr:ETS-related transcription factor Elf-4-like isoform X2 [Corticium candelabrum]
MQDCLMLSAESAYHPTSFMEMMDPGFSTIEMQDATTSMGLDFANSQSLATNYFEGVTVDSQEDAIDELLFQHGMQMNYPRPTYKQEYLASTCSQHDFQIYQLELPHRAVTGSTSSVCSRLSSTRSSPDTLVNSFAPEVDLFDLNVPGPFSSKSIDSLQSYTDSLPLPSASPPFSYLIDPVCNFTRSVSAGVDALDNSNLKIQNIALQQTERLIQLGKQRYKEMSAVNSSKEDSKQPVYIAVATSAVSHQPPSNQAKEKEKRATSEHSDKDTVADAKTLVKNKKAITEPASNEHKPAAKGYMFRPRDDESRKQIIDEEYTDVESPSSESEATSEEEEEGSDNDPYWPKSERNGQRGHGCGAGARLGNTAHSPQLWEFLLMVLDDTSKKSVMAWKDKGDGVFKIYNSGSAAKLWGKHKNKGNMNYDKMSRAMRYYYGKGIFEKVPGRLVYKFSQQAREKYANNKANLLYNRSIPQMT